MNYVQKAKTSQRLRKLVEACEAHYTTAGHRAGKYGHKPYCESPSSFMVLYDQAYLKAMWDYHLIAALTPVQAHRIYCVKNDNAGTDAIALNS